MYVIEKAFFITFARADYSNLLSNKYFILNFI